MSALRITAGERVARLWEPGDAPDCSDCGWAAVVIPGAGECGVCLPCLRNSILEEAARVADSGAVSDRRTKPQRAASDRAANVADRIRALKTEVSS